jgi:hypothetical protein
MDRHTADRIEGIIAALSEHIDVLAACGFAEARQLLSIAKLDLQMRVHGISDQELRALCDALEDRPCANPPADVIEFAPARRSKKSTR